MKDHLLFLVCITFGGKYAALMEEKGQSLFVSRLTPQNSA